MPRRIIGIRKPYGTNYAEDAISDYKYISDGSAIQYEISRNGMILWLDNNFGAYAYVQDGNKQIRCEIKNNGRIRFLQTISDGKEKNNLLELPRF